MPVKSLRERETERESSTKPVLIYIQYRNRASTFYSVTQITWVLPLLYRFYLLNMNAVRRISSSSRYEARCWCVGDKALCRWEAWTHTQAQTKALFHKRCLCWKNHTERAAVLSLSLLILPLADSSLTSSHFEIIGWPCERPRRWNCHCKPLSFNPSILF